MFFNKGKAVIIGIAVLALFLSIVVFMFSKVPALTGFLLGIGAMGVAAVYISRNNVATSPNRIGVPFS